MIEVVILDIEGTICPISFVKEGLFPYFLDKLPTYLEKLEYPIVKNGSSDVNDICSEFGSEHTRSYKDLLDHISQLVKNDVKQPALKTLQGYIWTKGYASHELKAPLYDDAIKFIENTKDSKKIYIYSSGSVKAQKLLFTYVEGKDGQVLDLKPSITDYFDITTSGYKNEAASYRSILASIGYEKTPESVLFLSDNVHEIKASSEALMQSVVVVRPGNAPLSAEDKNTYKTINSFDELSI